jgi:hypothetical protein
MTTADPISMTDTEYIARLQRAPSPLSPSLFVTGHRVQSPVLNLSRDSASHVCYATNPGLTGERPLSTRVRESLGSERRNKYRRLGLCRRWISNDHGNQAHRKNVRRGPCRRQASRQAQRRLQATWSPKSSQNTFQPLADHRMVCATFGIRPSADFPKLLTTLRSTLRRRRKEFRPVSGSAPILGHRWP